MPATVKDWFPQKNRLKSFIKNVDKMTPKAKALLVIKCAQKLCDFVGIRFLSDMKIFWLTFVAPTVALIYVLLVIYTVIYHTYNDNFLNGIKSTCTVAIAIPVSVFLFTFQLC